MHEICIGGDICILYIYTYVSTYICLYIHVYLYVHMYMSTYMSTYVYTQIIHMSIYIYDIPHIYTYIYMGYSLAVAVAGKHSPLLCVLCVLLVGWPAQRLSIQYLGTRVRMRWSHCARRASTLLRVRASVRRCACVRVRGRPSTPVQIQQCV